MGRVLAVVMLLGVMVFSACDAGSTGSAQHGNTDCFQGTIRVLYWPAGDPSAKTGSAERTDPHLEIFGGDGSSYRRRDRMLYASAKAFTGPCAGPRRIAVPFKRQMADKQSVHLKPTALTCKTDRVVAYLNLDVEPGYFAVAAEPRKLLDAAFTPHPLNPDGPLLRFDGKACTATSAPASPN